MGDKRVENLKIAQMKEHKDKEFLLSMAEDVWLNVKGYPIPDSYSEEDRIDIFARYYHRASSQRQGE